MYKYYISFIYEIYIFYIKDILIKVMKSLATTKTTNNFGCWKWQEPAKKEKNYAYITIVFFLPYL